MIRRGSHSILLGLLASFAAGCRASTPPPEARFELVTEQAGLAQRTAGGPGVAAADVDGDGDVDLYFTSIVGPGIDNADQLFLNDGSGHFEDASEAWGIARQSFRSWGAVFADLDNDGDPDLLVANSGRSDVYLNEGDRFVRRSDEAGFRIWDVEVYASSMNLADIDGDRFLDLYIVNHQFQGGNQVNGPFPEDEFYFGNGDGTFRDATHLLDASRTNNGGFVAGWSDFDEDADLDLYLVADSFVDPFKNEVFRNDGPADEGWRFTTISDGCGADVRMDGMGLAVGDYDGDAHLDFYVSNTGGEKLFRNLLGGFWEESVDAANALAGGDADREVSWGTEFVDVNNDTWPDLLVAFGGSETFVEARNSLLINDRGVFERDDAAGLAHAADSHGMAVFDMDRDGCMDVAINNLRSAPELHRNVCSGQWVGIELEGTESPRDPAGARVVLTVGDRVLVQELGIGSTSIHSGRWKGMHFGLGDATSIDHAEVHWPSGAVTEPALRVGAWNHVVE